jgi:hypothetical protein
VFIDLTTLKKGISWEEDFDEDSNTIQSEKIENILLDLHTLGVIVYFDHPVLRETIITDLKWFILFFF